MDFKRHPALDRIEGKKVDEQAIKTEADLQRLEEIERINEAAHKWQSLKEFVAVCTLVLVAAGVIVGLFNLIF